MKNTFKSFYHKDNFNNFVNYNLYQMAFSIIID